MTHASRPWLDRRHPVHVTLRADARAPSFRTELVAAIARQVFEELSPQRALNRARRVVVMPEDPMRPEDRPPVEGRKKRSAPRRHPRATDAIAARFHVVHFSLQEDHVHLLVEAADARALSAGMRRLVIRLANRINRAVRHSRHGKVWGDRYHRRDLDSPTAVRNALVYVLQNGRKHGRVDRDMLDPFSSADEFDGWADLPRDDDIPPLAPRTWLLGVGWIRAGGRIRLAESPRT